LTTRVEPSRGIRARVEWTDALDPECNAALTAPVPDAGLLDPKDDDVFKRVFGEAPELVVTLINDLRPDLPEIRDVEVINPGIRAEELSGKYIILDVLARDAAGHRYDVEIQVRRYGAWHRRGLHYFGADARAAVGRRRGLCGTLGRGWDSPARFRSVRRGSGAMWSGAMAFRDAR
jgi:hypothetical protein